MSDFSVCTTWGLKNDRIYLLHVVRERLKYPDLKQAVHDQAHIHRATVVLIEDHASGTQLLQDLKREGLLEATPCTSDCNKTIQMHGQTDLFKNEKVYLPRQASWRTDYIHELITFPNAKNDDQADSTSQALAWIKAGRSDGAISTFVTRTRRI